MKRAEVIQTVSAFREASERARRDGGLALVPTMGALHAGHVALIHEAARHAKHVALTLFVNPTQFGPTEDFAAYPRKLAEDVSTCEAAGVALVFAPDARELYPEGESTRVRVDGVSRALCGAARPGHFEGVATVVTKLFAVAGPCTAVFGRKDYQQLKVIERLTRDLLLPVRLVGVPTVREEDGLALSSRNAFLSAEERVLARALPRALTAAAHLFTAGARRVDALTGMVTDQLTEAGFRVDYVTLADPDTVQPLPADAHAPDRALLAVAAFLGKTRLIDNLVLGEERGPLDAPTGPGDRRSHPATKGADKP